MDANNNGLMEVGELTIPAVIMRLSGTLISGETIDRELTTDSNGQYSFSDLPAGTYTIKQVHPTGFIDGHEVVGTAGGIRNETASSDEIRSITIRPAEVATGYHFGERGLAVSHVSRYRLLSRPYSSGLLGNPIVIEMLQSQTQSASSSSGNAIAPTTRAPLSSSGLIGEGESRDLESRDNHFDYEVWRDYENPVIAAALDAYSGEVVDSKVYADERLLFSDLDDWIRRRKSGSV